MTETFNDVLIDGVDDVKQLRVQGHTTQNESLQTWEDSASDILAQMTGDGRLQLGDDLGFASPDALIEAHRADASTAKPKRAFHALGQVSDALNNITQWIVQELEVLGTSSISALQTALRVRASNKNTGTPAGGEVRAIDIEVTNEPSSATTLPQATGVRVGVTNTAGNTITDARGLHVVMDNAGTITNPKGLHVEMPNSGTTNPYAIFAEGVGAAHFEDYLELKSLATPPGTPATDFIRTYPKSDGKLYAKNWSGVEYDLTAAAISSLTEETAPTVDDKLLLNDVSEGADNALLVKNLIRPLDYKNLIINGSMDIWQRGTSFAAPSSGTYTVDRWVWASAGTGLVTISRSTDVPTADDATPLGDYSLQVAVTTADTSIASTDLYRIVQGIEGYNIRNLVGKKFSLSFWVKSPKTGTHCVAFRNGSGDRSYIATYTVNAANTWEYKTISLQSVVPTAGTWNYSNGNGLSVGFSLAAGSNFHTTADAWQSGSFLATSAQVNCLDSTSNVFKLFGVSLVEGEMPLPYQTPDFALELTRCQRYFQKSYDLNTAPGTSSASGFSSAQAVATHAAYGGLGFSVRMRADPTVVLYSYAGMVNKVSSVTPADVGTTVTGSAAETANTGIFDSGSGFTTGNTYLFHWTAAAEL